MNEELRLHVKVALMIIVDLLLLWGFLQIGEAAERFTLFRVVSDSVTLEWAPNTEEDLAGYRLHYAGAGGETGLWTTTETTLRVKVPLAQFWGRCRFWITAVDTAGNESAPSDTVATILSSAGPRLVGDIDGILGVWLMDRMLLNLAAGSRRGDLRYSERADLDGDGVVGLMDKMIYNQNAGATR